MKQLHKRFVAEEVKQVLTIYIKGNIDSQEAMRKLGIKRTRFFKLLRMFRQNSASFSIDYKRDTPQKISKKADQAIYELLTDNKKLLINPLGYNRYYYSKIRLALIDMGINVSVPTIIKKAKKWDFVLPEWIKQR